MKTALYLSIMIADAVIMTTLPDAGWFAETLLVSASIMAAIKALASFGDA